MQTKEVRRYQLIALLLAIGLVVMTVMWLAARNSYEGTIERLGQDLTEYRSQVEDTCGGLSGTELAQNEECVELLSELTELIRQYNERLAELNAGGTATVE